MMSIEISERLYQIRKCKKLTQKEFGKRIGLKTTTVSGLERAYRDLNPRILKLLEIEYNVNSTWLLTGTGEMFKEVESNIVEKEHIEIAREIQENKILHEIFNQLMELSETEQNKINKILKIAYKQ